MALTIAIEGKGIIANANAYSGDSAGGTWGELGGGSIGFNPDVYIYGSGSIGNQYASKSGYSYYNTPTALDFDTAGTEEGQFIYIWINIQSKGPFDTLANNGFSIRIGTSLSDYRDFKIAGKNDANGWAGGWKCFVLDPTKAGSVADTGTFDVGNVNYIGLWIDTDVSVRADSIFIDQIAVGSGLRITGTSTTGWKDVVDYCTAYASRAWGMFEEREGIYYAKGKIYIGDTTQTAITSFTDSGRVIKFETSEYYNISDIWVSMLPVDACGIVVEDAVSYITTFSDGVIVGTDNGRSGSTIIGNDNEDVSIDLYGGNNAASVTTLYGTVFKSIYGAINSGNDAQHKFLGCTFADCSQFDPVGGPIIRNCLFTETVDIDAALLWNANINIKDSTFIANALGAAIEMPTLTGSPFSYDNLLFSGNTYDVLNVQNASTINAGSFVVGRGYKILTVGTTDFTLIGAANNNIGTKFVATGVGAGTGTATQVLVINKTNGANPSTAENVGTASDTSFVGSVSLSIYIQDEDRDPIENVQTSIRLLADPYTELMNEDTLATGIASEAYGGNTPVDVVVKARKSEDTDDPRYQATSSIQTISSDGLALTITLKEQPLPI